ncbi:BREX-1 system adenine-specific DNA-methyltransferase PglX [Roseimaritima ulvae]|uniref:site-specific DNA-methyltransferase (adenine-specific) n=1 Tax=Roseimaritima ulvae TaxID=980254 RepID=A0A5B9QZD0_9BACT|nr:BREX-1 system adenine-specific DNA-methyltransferase PglX [Roseimaritima ulvae]QEG43432.1 N-6 DNA Methylase [Roseimaritima ulvae]
METTKLRKFASFARKSLIEQVGTKMKAVLAEGSLARRENAKAVADLEAKIAEVGKPQTIEMVAYTWFNRFCALRYMDVNRYTKIGILSPAEGQFLPEILGEAKAGHVDDEMVPAATREKVLRILDGTDPSDDPQGEAYRLLLVAACNHYHSLMPFLFEKISDYTELLLPDDLLSGSAIPTYTREALLPANSSPDYTDESVEVIGWLYQFYISEKKDDVFAALKKGKKITPENIPSATQLFTPHWIVRYLVENSLGRLWMLNHPGSRLAEQMDYYIQPEEPETDFLQISSPEEIKICDPACGSGHMLTYAFDLLYAIYEEQGYQATDIPRLILTHNLYGIEIDQRAGALAAFALTMKAREKYRRFLTGGKVVQPNICVLENVKIDPEDLSAYMDKVGRDLFSDGLQGVVNQWEEADNFGSLIRPLVTDVSEVLELLALQQMGEDLFLAGVHQKVLKALRQADYLSPKYHVVVANPPYMGKNGMNRRLVAWTRDVHPKNKADLFGIFIERSLETVVEGGIAALVTIQNWMFLSSFCDMRSEVLESSNINSLVHIGFNSFPELNSKFALACAFSLTKTTKRSHGVYYDLNSAPKSADKQAVFLEKKANSEYYVTSQDRFSAIEGAPIAYWVSERTRQIFETGVPVGEHLDVRLGMATTDNKRFLRLWHEVSLCRIGFACSSLEESIKSRARWFPYNKGGAFRKWYGNLEYVVDYESGGERLKSVVKEKYRDRDYAEGFTEEKWDKLIEVWVLKNQQFYFHPSITWSFVGLYFGVRYSDPGFIFDVGGSSAFTTSDRKRKCFTGLLCSKLSFFFMKSLNASLNFQVENIKAIPVLPEVEEVFDDIEDAIDASIALVKNDWNAYEVAWDFATLPLFDERLELRLLEDAYQALRGRWSDNVSQLAELERENNRLLIDAYRLQDELTPETSHEQVTLTCNPAFRYGSDKSEEELEALLLADTMREFISYAVGCMLGRYSLDKPGLILANQGDSLREYFGLTILDFGLEGEYDDSRLEECKAACTFCPDDDNVIPMLDGDWFTDDISERFKEFLKVTFGTEHYAENLQFLEDALYPENNTGRKRKTIRDYFLKEFYNHHVKLYKKRPIYWLFSSPKGTFNALIYMHRYRPDTVSSVLQYLRDFRDKLAHRRDHQQMVADSGGSTTAEKAKALKEVTAIKKQLKELEEYERDTLFPLAQQKIEIDLDDGVKHNYPLFGKALKKVTGLS